MSPVTIGMMAPAPRVPEHLSPGAQPVRGGQPAAESHEEYGLAHRYFRQVWLIRCHDDTELGLEEEATSCPEMPWGRGRHSTVTSKDTSKLSCGQSRHSSALRAPPPTLGRGLSEYQRNFLWKKSYLTEACPSRGRRYPWAGLRSDQLGITREPSFLSKRRVPHHDPQISKSLEWDGATSGSRVAVSPKPEVPELPGAQGPEHTDAAQQGVLALEASSVPKRTRSHSEDSGVEGASEVVENKAAVTARPRPAADPVGLEPATKPPLESVDAGVFHNKSQSVPQFKGSSVIHETEYKRNFKGLSPAKEPTLRSDLREDGSLEAVAPEKKCNKADGPSRLEAGMEGEASSQPKKLSPWRHQRLGKVNSEYRAKFLSPAQYLCKAGVWTRVKEGAAGQGALNAMWYAEVKELREKAEFYRKRVLGTHFSRDHLNQILSENNRCWDVSSTASSEGTVSSSIRALDLAGDPTLHKTLQKCPSTKPEEKGRILEEQPQKDGPEKQGVSDAPAPVRRRLAWDAAPTTEDVQKQPVGEEEEGRRRAAQVPGGEPEGAAMREKPQEDGLPEGSEASSLSSGRGGRLPTPTLRELGGVQRTHHDLTTPAVGGAVLVSPSKVRPPEQRKRASSQDFPEPSKSACTKKGSRALALLTSPAAGVKTVDPLPLREDTEVDIHRPAGAAPPASEGSEHRVGTPGPSPSPLGAPAYWHPARRIQGSLRDPEFQHNVGKARMNNLQLPEREAFNDEDEDRLSEISARSAASSLRAFQTLARAKKRKEAFWGQA
ncbi:nuclear protein MDM1 [Carlito syrichta]|uniref:Nuclear protein MDM1 n=1 Tax=Carlito syrichta TaxID=1868482 RepID=A0A3Q0EC75_CARSF|nr:nuclear protein MDM1 [Carlito syrichta]